EPSTRLRLDDHALGHPCRRSSAVAALEDLSDFERPGRCLGASRRVLRTPPRHLLRIGDLLPDRLSVRLDDHTVADLHRPSHTAGLPVSPVPFVRSVPFSPAPWPGHSVITCPSLKHADCG